jgi:hypothetical protein
MAQARADTDRIDDCFTFTKAFAVSKISAALAEMRYYKDAADTAEKLKTMGCAPTRSGISRRPKP